MPEQDKREPAIRLHRERKPTIAKIFAMMGISKSTLCNYLAESFNDAISKEQIW